MEELVLGGLGGKVVLDDVIHPLLLQLLQLIERHGMNAVYRAGRNCLVNHLICVTAARRTPASGLLFVTSSFPRRDPPARARARADAYAHMQTHTHTHHPHACTLSCTHARMHTRMHACTHARTMRLTLTSVGRHERGHACPRSGRCCAQSWRSCSIRYTDAHPQR